jgi:uncharacterized protein
MLKWFLPKEIGFYSYFSRVAELSLEACTELVHLANDGSNVAAHARRIKELEHHADEVSHQCIDALHKTFITPFDRGDIHRLTKRLDDILDAVNQAALRMEMYEIREIRPEVKDLANLLVSACKEVIEALKLLNDTKNAAQVMRHCNEVYTLEGQADVIVRRGVATVYKQGADRPLLVMQWREIFDALEKSANRCEDVANVIEGILIEAS